MDALDEQDFVEFVMHQPLSEQGTGLGAGSVKEQAKGWAVGQVEDWAVAWVEGLAKQAEAQAAIQKVDPLVTVDQHHPEHLE